MLTMFFNVHHEFAPPGQTVNKNDYIKVLHQGHAPWVSGDWLLHHNNAPAYSSHLVEGFLAKKSHHLVLQPPPTAQIWPYVTSGSFQN